CSSDLFFIAPRYRRMYVLMTWWSPARNRPIVFIRLKNLIVSKAMAIKFGVIGSGSWATALVKIITDSGNTIHWWVRNEASAGYIKTRAHNPHYLTSAVLKTDRLAIDT